MSTALKIILDDFANIHDMRRIRRDAHGVFTLVFDHQWVINVESDPLSGTVSIFGSAGSVQPELGRPASAPEIEWHPISEQELPFGGRIGVHYKTGVVMLDSQSDPARLDTVAFRLWLLAFVDQMSAWASRIGPRVRSARISEQMQHGSPPPAALAAVDLHP
ncbi:type III secretion system chaperone [Lacisediminimonas profundi]|uniref:type III secretion system chaperone n=1 Tax=Lacisediminimonas profundi TaxID=2603856 RepID=UPI00124AE47E|nr:type III secretion system chaperone [Lacisediminimonas profundi]